MVTLRLHNLIIQLVHVDNTSSCVDGWGSVTLCGTEWGMVIAAAIYSQSSHRFHLYRRLRHSKVLDRGSVVPHAFSVNTLINTLSYHCYDVMLLCSK